MAELVDFLRNNIDKIWTLLATFVGAVISYAATTAAEKRKEKRGVQREKLKDVLIPLCASVEEALDAMNQYKTVSSSDFDQKLKKPTEFLKAEKRVFLSKQQRELLKTYDDAVKDFYKTWNDEQKMTSWKYRHWISEKLRDCPSSPVAMDVNVSLSLKSEDLRADILGNKIHSYKNQVTGATFVIDDDPDNYRDAHFSFDENIKNLCGEMQYGISTLDDITDTGIQHTCEIYDFLWGIDDNPILEELRDGLTSNDKLFELVAKTKKLQERLLKDIDKIAS